ncbi:universal stress protein [Psychromonas ossibalaenae]|uniref:universal stress protein n=1 Tax=Psychromonas ossibalaenae TaxID=444922 RepID=UPI000382A574|nr:universal stress protein [Psychromonas ossibalaenae]
MSYKHILVAVDLSKSSEKVINKAVELAKDADAKLSFIFVDVSFVSSIALAQPKVEKLAAMNNEKEKHELHQQLQALADRCDYPVAETVVVMGDLNQKLHTAIKGLDIDLLVCGHHHDFWSNMTTSVKKFIKTAVSDLLIVYLDKED